MTKSVGLPSEHVKSFDVEIKDGGLRSRLRRGFEALVWRYSPDKRRFARELQRQQIADREYDERYQVDTSGDIELCELGVSPANALSGNGRYRPVWQDLFYSAITDLMSRIPDGCPGYTFMDFGSGKGKALLMASEFPFAAIIGIEYSILLHEAAHRNIELYRRFPKKCHVITSIHQDAREATFPLTPLVCFFFNPFDDTTLTTVLDRLRNSLAIDPRPAYLVYLNVRDIREQERVFRRAGFLSVLHRQKHYLILAS